jgi:ASC-1-like (ASCH) protein
MDNYINLLDGSIQFGGNESISTSVDYTENVSEPWFSLISLGLKTVEGRKNKGRFASMKPGQIIKWVNEDFKPRFVLTKIVRVTRYDTFEDYLTAEGLGPTLPSINDIETGLSVYFKYFTKEDEAQYGVIAIQMEKII